MSVCTYDRVCVYVCLGMSVRVCAFMCVFSPLYFSFGLFLVVYIHGCENVCVWACVHVCMPLQANSGAALLIISAFSIRSLH